jgi:hypothetical protein
VRRVPAQRRALAQSLAHQTDVALLQVAHATVHELGGTARRRRREVAGFDQRRAIAARRGVDRGAESGRTAADHDDVERLLG